jgi:hypothetical protein
MGFCDVNILFLLGSSVFLLSVIGNWWKSKEVLRGSGSQFMAPVGPCLQHRKEFQVKTEGKVRD